MELRPLARLPLLLACGILACRGSDASSSSPKSIVDTVVEAGGFGALRAALDRAGLTGALGAEGPFTVFAPTDAAFAALAGSLGLTAEELLESPSLTEMLTLHVLGAKVLSANLSDGGYLGTLQGSQIRVVMDSGAVSVGGAGVITPDVLCSNGVIHVVDSVLQPPERLVLAGGLQGWTESSWTTVLDGVMGGKSSGTFRVDGQTMIFTGSINNDGGGFASIRKRFTSLDLSDHAGLWMEMEAAPFSRDEPPLGLHIQLSDNSGFGFAAPIAIPAASRVGGRVRAFLPISSFDRASRSGYQCSVCRLNSARIRELSVYVLFQSGPFQVRLVEISAVREATHGPAAPPAVAITALAEPGAVSAFIGAATISGGYVYDKGYHGLCEAIYTSVAASTVKTAEVASSTRGVMCAGLRRAADATDHTDRAWILRRAFDAVLADGGSADRPPVGQYPSSAQGDWLPGAGAAAEAAARQCAFFGVRPVTPSNSVADAGAATEAVSSSDFVGPFVGFGITGHNDLGRHTVSDPEECASLCRESPLCRSFDYGARQHVTGECWLSTADRASVGSAYSSRWALYDYYEKVDGTTVSAADPPSDDDDDDAFAGSLAFWSLVVGAALVGALSLVIVYLIRRVKAVQGSAELAAQASPGLVVMGRPASSPSSKAKLEDDIQVQAWDAPVGAVGA